MVGHGRQGRRMAHNVPLTGADQRHAGAAQLAPVFLVRAAHISNLIPLQTRSQPGTQHILNPQGNVPL
jgi:hypothetical protein